jgi:hypothetical protein
VARVNEFGSVTAGCDRCHGGLSTFEWKVADRELGAVIEAFDDFRRPNLHRHFRLFRCAGCGRGGLGVFTLPSTERYPSKYLRLERFTPDVTPRVSLPSDTPKEIVFEYREGEECIEARCNRAAAAMFRSSLEKTLIAAGYKVKRENLFEQIEAAAGDGTITEARKKRAHDEIRVLGNDVLHDAWREISDEEVTLARDYTQRIIEDFYDHRSSTLAQLRAKGRIPAEDITGTSAP